MMWFQRRKKSKAIGYWVNGFGPMETREEQEQMHELLREVSEWNLAARREIAKRRRGESHKAVSADEARNTENLSRGDTTGTQVSG